MFPLLPCHADRVAGGDAIPSLPTRLSKTAGTPKNACRFEKTTITGSI
jgi:hypothetical protein